MRRQYSTDPELEILEWWLAHAEVAVHKMVQDYMLGLRQLQTRVGNEQFF